MYITNSLTIFVNWNFQEILIEDPSFYEGWNFNSGNYLFTTDTK